MTRLPGPATVALRPFATAAAAIGRISARILRPAPQDLQLQYALQGNLAGIRIPEVAPTAAPAGPTDGLWQHTCMEVFVSPVQEDAPAGAYLEFNLAPSGRWAAYRFSGYRAGMAPLTGIRPPRIRQRMESDQLLLCAQVQLPAELAAAGLRLGLAVVVEDCQGLLSYWALRHTGRRPDFHHPDSFEFEI